jgi:hypothetical protein
VGAREEADGRIDAALGSLGAAFAIEGTFRGAQPLGSGHIHRTFVARYAGPRSELRVVHQRLNTAIFGDPHALMDNVVRVTEHVRRKLAEAGCTDPERRCLRVLRTRDGGLLHVDSEGGVWRTLSYLEATRTFTAFEGADRAFEAARAFGSFARQLADLPGPPLQQTIPHFHDFPRRVRALQDAVQADPCGRASAVADEIEALRAHGQELQRALAAQHPAALPRRIAHHDCKLDNLLWDETGEEALCVIDLDTVMQGTLLSDFGELVRSGTNTGAEDDPDWERVDFDLELFEGLARGYLAGTGPLLSGAERRALVLAGPLLTLMNAVRFLTDHLEGDVYFRRSREGQNLDRARVHLRLAQRMLDRSAEMRARLERA